MRSFGAAKSTKKRRTPSHTNLGPSRSLPYPRASCKTSRTARNDIRVSHGKMHRKRGTNTDTRPWTTLFQSALEGFWEGWRSGLFAASDFISQG